MNKRKLTKTFNLTKWVMFVFFTVGLTMSSCKNYDDDITRIDGEITNIKSDLAALQAAVAKGHAVESITKNDDGTTTIKLTNGVSYAIGGGTGVATDYIQIKDGTWWINNKDSHIPVTGPKGEQGTPGTPGEPGKPGEPGTATMPEFTIGANGNWFIDGRDSGQKAQGPQGEKGDQGTTGPGNGITIIENTDGTYSLSYKNEAGETITLPMNKSTNVVTGIKFIPSVLSGGEAARIHFPTIVTDSVLSTNSITGADWTTGNYRTFKIIYSGKAEFKYQVNPSTVSFDSFEVEGFARDTAEIWNYNTNDKKWLFFNAKLNGGMSGYPESYYYKDNFQFYTDDKGILVKEKSYAEGKGLLTFRAKDWAFAEQANLNERTVYSLRLKNGSDIVHSDFIPAKHEVILQKNVYLVRNNFDDPNPGYAAPKAPNTIPYRNFIKDEFYKKAQKSYTPTEYLRMSDAQKAAVEALSENQLYLKDAVAPADQLSLDDPRIHINLPYKDAEKDLKKIILNFFNGRTGKNPASEYILENNGFDDYTLVFEPVDFYYQGVDQTRRYLDLDLIKQGIAKVKMKSVWGDIPSDHTAAIDRTPIVRVKLVAPGEDNNNVVKTAIIKIRITGSKSTPDITVTGEKEVTLLHIDQEDNMDMDPIFNHDDVQLSSQEFYDKYEFTPIVGGTMFVNDQTHVTLTETIKTVGTQFYNQLVLGVKNIAFNSDCITYHALGKYTLKPGKAGPVQTINIDYTVKVKYPEVNKPVRSDLVWKGNSVYAHGKYNENPVTLNAARNTDSYRMETVLNNYFVKGYKYPNYVADIDHARVTLSYELVDKHNDASEWVGHSGIQLIQRLAKDLSGNPVLDDKGQPTTEWVLQLERSDLGRKYIYTNNAEADASTSKDIKVRMYASFNECVDGLYGSGCIIGGGRGQYKFSKSHPGIATEPDLVIGKLIGQEICSVADSHGVVHGDAPVYTAEAPDYGRNVLLEEFTVKFIDPVTVVQKPITPLYDKYMDKLDLNKVFRITEYLYKGAIPVDGYIIYDTDMANKTATHPNTDPKDILFDANGWNPILKDEFEVQYPFSFRYIGATNTSGGTINLGEGQRFEIDPVTNMLTWVNNGGDIQIPFYAVIEVSVLHKWGSPFNYAPNQLYGRSVFNVNIPVSPWQGTKKK